MILVPLGLDATRYLKAIVRKAEPLSSFGVLGMVMVFSRPD